MSARWQPALEALLLRHWWRPQRSALAQTLRPLSWLYGALARLAARRAAPRRLPVPVVVVGNLIVGGAGKTPTVIALVEALREAGWQPGVISRGHGRAGSGVQRVDAATRAQDAGDEPWLIARRTGVPVWVGRQRVDAGLALCAAQPEVDVIVADDGLQHHALARDAELIVFDERGIGNGLLLPAGPLREALPARLGARQRVLYNAPAPSTNLPGLCATRSVRRAIKLADWHAGSAQSTPLPMLAAEGAPWVAAAGIASPERFFQMLELAGLRIERLPLPDHHDYAALPWPAGTPRVLVTEKDAAKLAPARLGQTAVWVVPLDFMLPDDIVPDLCRLLGTPRTP